MASGLPKKAADFRSGIGAKIAIVQSMWHSHCVEPMVERAKRELIRCGVREGDISVYSLPGSLELPYAAKMLLSSQPELDLVIAFGVVLQGGTTHDKTVIETVVRGFLDVTRDTGKPVINEVIGVADIKLAEDRSRDDDNNKGLEAAFAALELIHFRREACRLIE
jgi:6,7-dimethyl-8-ribityllumazine synthase